MTQRTRTSILLTALVLSCHLLPAQQANRLKLWFMQPASSWNEALPVGNGRLGAMIFGGVGAERVQLNEQTVWAGKKEDFVHPGSREALPQVRKLLFGGKYAEAQKLAQEKMMGDKQTWSNYQTLGDLNFTFANGKGELSGYTRELDLDSALSRVNYTWGNTTFTREAFSSAPDSVLAFRFGASRKGAVSFSLRYSRPGNKASVTLDGNEGVVFEHVNGGTGVRMVARFKVLADGGTVTVRDSGLHVTGADNAVLFLSAATDYYNGDPYRLSKSSLHRAAAKGYEAVRGDHIRDYQRYFKRMDLDLGTSEAAYFPTDARLRAVQAGNTDPALIRLYFQFGRYLLISSSRPGGLPANLQGIWADGLTPPWSADYHININIQMNYWPAEVTNLPEMHEPFLRFLHDLVPDGRKTARSMYGLPGAVAHFTTDAFHFTETYGQTQWAMWPMGLAWSAQHLWEHYLFTGDRNYLAQAYPVLQEAAIFCAAWLTEDPQTGRLVSGPSISPENTFRTKSGDTATMVMGPTMDHMIIRDLLQNTMEAGRVLGRDKSLIQYLEKKLARLAPTRIGSDGRIMEWTEEFEEPEPGHRHISHLFGLHPGRQITARTPELLEAARKTLEYRLKHGGGHTGWSRAWIVNFFARLQDGEAAYENIQALLKKSTLPNLFDNHPPFQIDGNFGAPAGIAEMLLQSHAGEVHLLPALPKAWPEGSVYGLVARGGFEVRMQWEEGKLKDVELRSRLGLPCTLRYGSKTFSLQTEKGKTYRFSGSLEAIR